MKRVLSAVVVTWVLFAIKGVALQFVHIALFGVLHLAFIDLVYVAPLIGLIVLVAGRSRGERPPIRRLTSPVRVVAYASLLLLPIGLYATLIEPYRLQVERATVEIPPARDGGRAIRVAVLADIQTTAITDYEKRVLRVTLDEKPDLILIAGDIFQGRDWLYEPVKQDFRNFFKQLRAPYGVYCIEGDVDEIDRLRDMFSESEVKLLLNDVARINVGDRRVTIIGTELDYTSPHVQRVLGTFRGSRDEGDIRILLTHRPDVVREIPEDVRIDLVVAGHTHGGQVVIPFFGPPITLSHVPRAVAAGGLHEVDGIPIYVSRGIGHERGMAPRVRFCCPPEVSVLTVESAGGEQAQRVRE